MLCVHARSRYIKDKQLISPPGGRINKPAPSCRQRHSYKPIFVSESRWSFSQKKCVVECLGNLASNNTKQNTKYSFVS